MTPEPPSASDGVETHADWIELAALTAADRNYSISDLVAELTRAGTAEAVADIADEDPRSEISAVAAEHIEGLASEALIENEWRSSLCGRGYPFAPQGRYVQASRNASSTLYVFLLLLSQFGPGAGSKELVAPRIFERIAGLTAQRYLSGGHRSGTARHYLLGAPREFTPKQFPAAVDQLGEGQGCRTDRPKLKDVKDGKVDIVAWLPFQDRRGGQVVAFGQCATGKNWRDKLTELQPRDFCHKWLKDRPAVDPVKMFFVPHRVPQDDWLDVSISAGVVFDRLRIVAAVGALERDLWLACAAWNQHVLKEWRRKF